MTNETKELKFSPSSFVEDKNDIQRKYLVVSKEILKFIDNGIKSDHIMLSVLNFYGLNGASVHVISDLSANEISLPDTHCRFRNIGKCTYKIQIPWLNWGSYVSIAFSLSEDQIKELDEFNVVFDKESYIKMIFGDKGETYSDCGIEPVFVKLTDDESDENAYYICKLSINNGEETLSLFIDNRFIYEFVAAREVMRIVSQPGME